MDLDYHQARKKHTPQKKSDNSKGGAGQSLDCEKKAV